MLHLIDREYADVIDSAPHQKVLLLSARSAVASPRWSRTGSASATRATSTTTVRPAASHSTTDPLVL